jgi:hypothetical protein
VDAELLTSLVITSSPCVYTTYLSKVKVATRPVLASAAGNAETTAVLRLAYFVLQNDIASVFCVPGFLWVCGKAVGLATSQASFCCDSKSFYQAAVQGQRLQAEGQSPALWPSSDLEAFGTNILECAG